MSEIINEHHANASNIANDVMQSQVYRSVTSSNAMIFKDISYTNRSQKINLYKTYIKITPGNLEIFPKDGTAPVDRFSIGSNLKLKRFVNEIKISRISDQDKKHYSVLEFKSSLINPGIVTVPFIYIYIFPDSFLIFFY